MKLTAALPALLLLAACGGSGAAENTADQLDQAAEQSDPAAAQVLENAAEAVRDGNALGAQDALNAAGNAQAATVSQTPAPPSQQAQPHRPGDPVPPPKATSSSQ